MNESGRFSRQFWCPVKCPILPLISVAAMVEGSHACHITPLLFCLRAFSKAWEFLQPSQVSPDHRRVNIPGGNPQPAGDRYWWAIPNFLPFWRGKSEAHSTQFLTGSATGLNPVAPGATSCIGFFSYPVSPCPQPHSLLPGITFPITTSSHSLSQALPSANPSWDQRFLEVAPFKVDQHLGNQ